MRNGDVERDYPLEQWYAAGFVEEFTEKPLARTLCDRQIVFWRTSDGSIAALTDRCPHRKAPLSLGMIREDRIECPFHGMLFGADGKCVDIPCQDKIPPDAHLRSYPVVERHGHVWIWMGVNKPDESLIPDLHWMTDPALGCVHGMMEFGCNYLTALDNLLDDTHLSYVHRNTIGTPKIVKARPDIEGGDDWVGFTRWTYDTPPSHLHKMAGGFTTNVDRWFYVKFVSPATVLIDVGSAPVGSGAPTGNRSKGIALWSNGTITPRTHNTCWYFWHNARNFKVDDAGFNETMRVQFEATFVEDKDIVEAVQRNRECDAENIPELNLSGDVVCLRARRIIANLIRSESTVLSAAS